MNQYPNRRNYPIQGPTTEAGLTKCNLIGTATIESQSNLIFKSHRKMILRPYSRRIEYWIECQTKKTGMPWIYHCG